MTTSQDIFESLNDYYVSLVRAGRVALLAGPFPTHAEALATVQRARDEANRVDPFTWFDPCGTCSLPRGTGPRGKLNGRLGI